MLESVLSTYKILKDKACNADIDESWINWAIEMMQAGYEVDSLYELAGISAPFNQFELQSLTNQVLKDLNLDYSDKNKVLKGYIYFLLKVNIDNTNKYDCVLKEFMNIYYAFEINSEYQKFALLYWAKEDLLYNDRQDYWNGADKSNIDKIIKEQFEIYINKFEHDIYF